MKTITLTAKEESVIYATLKIRKMINETLSDMESRFIAHEIGLILEKLDKTDETLEHH